MKYAAFLRGIAPMNPNMHNEKLRGVCEDLGFTQVKSIISSGNLIFESDKSAKAIEKMLEAAWREKLGFESTTIVRSLGALKKLVAADPFAGHEHSQKTSLNVTFLQQKAPKDTRPPEGPGYVGAAQFDREICTIIDTTSAKTPNYMAKAERAYGKKITTRTWKTIQRVVALLEA